MRKKKEIVNALELVRIGHLNSLKVAKLDPSPANLINVINNKSHITILEYVLGFENDFADWVRKYNIVLKKARARVRNKR